MKLFFVLIFAFIAACHGFSQPIIRDTKASGCFDGQCGDHCAWDGVKLLQFGNLNQPGKCRLLQCNKNFDIAITPCPFDETGKYEYVGKDNSKLYPECCGTKTLKKSAGK